MLVSFKKKKYIAFIFRKEKKKNNTKCCIIYIDKEDIFSAFKECMYVEIDFQIKLEA